MHLVLRLYCDLGTRLGCSTGMRWLWSRGLLRHLWALGGARAGPISRRRLSVLLPSLWTPVWRRRGVRALRLGVLLVAGCASTGEARASPHVPTARLTVEQVSAIAAQADGLYEANRWRDALDFLSQYSTCEEAEIQWRLARLCYKVGKYKCSNQNESESLSKEGMAYAERSLELDDSNFACHKWMGILLSWSSEFQGYKKKIERSFDIRDHFLKAIELNPTDATCRHLLGQWCYSVSSVPWYQKKVAQVIFATPPNSSYEEALHHFENAEKVDPGFYSTNWLFMGKCYLQLGKREEARAWLTRAAEYKSQVADDQETAEEAKALLSKL